MNSYVVRSLPMDDWPGRAVEELEKERDLVVDMIYLLPWIDDEYRGRAMFIHQTNGDIDKCEGWVYSIKDGCITSMAPITRLFMAVNVTCSYAAHLHMDSFEFFEVLREVMRSTGYGQ